MLDIGWTEIVVIAVVALVVLGPKELPRALKTFGALMSKARSMAREFQSGVDEMIRESELDDLRKDLQQATRLDFDDSKDRKIDPTSGRRADAAAPAELPAPAAPDVPAAAAPAIEAPAASDAPAVRPAPIAAMPSAAPANEDSPPFSALNFDQDYPRATELQAAGDFLPPDAEESSAEQSTAKQSTAKQSTGARPAEERSAGERPLDEDGRESESGMPVRAAE